VENIILPGYPGGTPRAQLLARAEALLADLQLAHRRDAKVEWLSGGEQQRVAICRALINDPEVLIADEPTANLDSTLSAEFLAILRRLAEAGRTVILTSHDPLVVESEVVDRVYSLRDGRLIEVVDTRKAWP
ncbi:MAG: ATP-binding cassette domain-containing protein, partial [Thauera sp.]|nr:ATP-binding cassette domain-containing protein [Thauera sp.]